MSIQPHSVSADEPTPPVHRKISAEINRVVTDFLAETAEILSAAKTPSYFAALEDFDVTSEQIADLQSDWEAANALKTQVLAARRDERVQTQEESEDATNLIAAIERIWTGVHLKYDGEPNKEKKERELQRYFVGTDLHVAHARLQNIAETVLLQLASETLPSVKEKQIEALKAALADFADGVDEEGTGDADAQGLYAQLLALIETMKPKRRYLQIAADGAFPYREKKWAEERKRFHLPLKQRFV